jgi:hypothetical protein
VEVWTTELDLALPSPSAQSMRKRLHTDRLINRPTSVPLPMEPEHVSKNVEFLFNHDMVNHLREFK